MNLSFGMLDKPLNKLAKRRQHKKNKQILRKSFGSFDSSHSISVINLFITMCPRRGINNANEAKEKTETFFSALELIKIIMNDLIESHRMATN